MRSTARSPIAWSAAAVILLLAVVSAVVIVLSARHVADLQADREAREIAAEGIIPIVGVLSSAVDDAASGSSTTSRQIAVDNVEAAGIPTAAAVRARDTGAPVVEESGSGLIVAAVFEGGKVPESVAERRELVTAYRIVELRLTSALSPRRPDGGGIAVSGPERTVASLPGPAPEGAAPYTVQLSQRLAPGWTLTVWTPRGAVPMWAWIVAGLVLVGGAAAAGWVVVRGTRVVQSREELGRLREQSATVAGVATVAQHSLDLAEVLPAFTTELSEALGLRGLSLGTPTPQGDRLFFAWGETPSVPDGLPGLPAEIEAGQTVSTMLSRGGRTVARLTVLAGRRLDRYDVATLAAVSDILTSALANADAFEQQRELVQRMRSVDELKTVFLATASHELRTPVGVITGYARILSTNWDKLSSEKGRTYAERVDTNAQRLSTLVEDLLDFSRLERGVGLAVDDSVFDLGHLVSRILEQHNDLAPSHQVEHQTAGDLSVLGSEQAVERVVTNLVGNAAKYSPAGTTIRVKVREERGRAELIVDDEGPGVPLAEREQIFSRFFRGRSDAVVNTRGAGLGLAIVSEFAASMGGRVSVSASEGGGARFVVSYPLDGFADVTEGESDVAS